MSEGAGKSAVVVGVGPGLGAALGRRLAREGYRVALAARSERVTEIAGAIDGARGFSVDSTDEAAIDGLFDTAERELGPVGIAVFNVSARVRGAVADLSAADFQRALMGGCYGGFLVGRAAARLMLPRKSGTILFTGATASVKGYPRSGSFAAQKFGLRGLSQSMARELQPEGIHVAHVVIDGSIGIDEAGDSRLRPDDLAEIYWHLHCQPRSTWAAEIEVRPWVEPF